MSSISRDLGERAIAGLGVIALMFAILGWGASGAFAQFADGIDSASARFDGPSDSGGQFGTQIVNIGDQDFDGKSDFVVAQPLADPGSAGSIYFIYSGKYLGSGPYDLGDPNIRYRVNGNTPGDRFGFSLAHVPDMSGDAKDELLVGAPGAGTNDQGRAYLIYSQAMPGSNPGDGTQTISQVLSSPDRGYTIEGDPGVAGDPDGHIGFSVGTVANMNGVGLDAAPPELIVGDPNGSGTSGKAAVVWGIRRNAPSNCFSTPQTVVLSAGWETPAGTQCGFEIHGSTSTPAGFGNAVAGLGIGDVGGPGGAPDGLPDFAVAASTDGFTNGGTRAAAGNVYVLWGKGTTTAVEIDTLSSTTGYAISGPAANSQLTQEGSPQTTRPGLLTVLLDMNGDGIGELGIGDALLDTASTTDSGGVFVVFLEKGRNLTAKGSVDLAQQPGQGSGLGSWIGFNAFGQSSGDNFGYPDVSFPLAGDPTPDILSGAPGVDGGRGVTYELFGQATSRTLDLAAAPAEWGWKVGTFENSGRLGTSGTSIGDWNGDVLYDLAIGAPASSNNGRFNSGSVYIVTARPTPTVVTLDPTQSTNVTLRGTVNPNNFGGAVGWFELRDAAGSLVLSTSSRPVPNGTTPAEISSDVANLQPCTSYSYRILGQNGDGFLVTGSYVSFTTTCSTTSTTFGTVPAEPASCADVLVAADGKTVSKYVSFAGTKARLVGPTGGYALAGSKLKFELEFRKLAGEKKVKQADFYLDGAKIGKKPVTEPIFGVTFKTTGLASSPDAGVKHTLKAVATLKGKKGTSKSFSLSWKQSDCKRTTFSMSVKSARKANNTFSDVTSTLNGVGAVLSEATVKLSKYLKIVPKASKKIGTAKLTVDGKTQTLSLKISRTTRKTAKSLVLYDASGTKFSMKKSKQNIWSLTTSGLPAKTTKVVTKLNGKATHFVILKKYCSAASFSATAKGGSKGNTVKLSATSSRSCKTKKK